MIAELEERESVYERREWRDERQWAPAPVASDDTSPPEQSGVGRSWRRIRESDRFRKLTTSQKLKQMFARKGGGGK